MTALSRRLRIEPRPNVFTARRPPDIGFVVIARDNLATHIGPTILPPTAMVQAMIKTYGKVPRLELAYYAEIQAIPDVWPRIRAALVKDSGIVALRDLVALVRSQTTPHHEPAVLTEWLSSEGRLEVEAPVA